MTVTQTRAKTTQNALINYTISIVIVQLLKNHGQEDIVNYQQMDVYTGHVVRPNNIKHVKQIGHHTQALNVIVIQDGGEIDARLTQPNAMMPYAWMEEAVYKVYMLSAIAQKDGKEADAKGPLNIVVKCLVGQMDNANPHLRGLNATVLKVGEDKDATKI